MTLKLGQIIRSLRAENGVTQEVLAAALDVTPQAVSRWESAYCYPDMEMLPSIADFFSVSIDELLGYRPTERETTLASLKAEAERLEEIGSIDERIAHCRTALISFPFDFDLKLYLASALSARWSELPQKDSALADEIEELYTSIIEGSRDHDTRYTAIFGLCSLLGDMARTDEARALIGTHLSPLKYCRELLLAAGIGDGNTETYIQDAIGKLTDSLGLAIRSLALCEDLPNDPSTWDKKLEMLSIANRLYSMIYGNDLRFYHIRLSKNHWLRSTYQIAQGKTADALDSLECMCRHTLAYDDAKQNDHGKFYTSILTDKRIYPHPSSDAHELTEHNDAYCMLARLQHKRYDPIRENERFAAVAAALAQTAR